MDIQTIDNQYGQLQTRSQQTVGELQGLAQKLQAAAQAGNMDAREWLLDLRGVALAIKAEQDQVANLLQAIHNMLAAQPVPQSVPQAMPQSPWGAPQGYPQQGGYPPQGYAQPQQGGLLGAFLNSGFGRALEMGAGFGIGEDIINKIF
ncbi:hypothetical protein [Acidocella sp. KAb 2-4]|uniref:hypothetical protein n=1 Tax=Acidocella sp. KAb 2-4 TaxID=2885158 RepID=UPI001D081347|nr:hypothetical protein [Acidocella sp. KAb 2-4]MCB5943889.1 hypothetical protein [Acidocella sp. KAb 2-4]